MESMLKIDSYKVSPFNVDEELDDYFWVEDDRVESRDVLALALECFPHAVVLITSWDSSRLEPNLEMRSAGWRSVASGALSPPLSSAISVPSAGWDEWWLLDPSKEAWSDFPLFEPFVNNTAWMLDGRGEEPLLEYLVPEQRRFWSVLRTVQPLAYFSTGSTNNFVANKATVLRLVEFVARRM